MPVFRHQSQVSLFLSEKISFWNSRLYDRETALDILCSRERRGRLYYSGIREASGIGGSVGLLSGYEWHIFKKTLCGAMGTKSCGEPTSSASNPATPKGQKGRGRPRKSSTEEARLLVVALEGGKMVEQNEWQSKDLENLKADAYNESLQASA